MSPIDTPKTMSDILNSATHDDAMIPINMVAPMLGRSIRQLRLMIKRKQIPARKEHNGRLYIFSSEISRYLGRKGAKR